MFKALFERGKTKDPAERAVRADLERLSEIDPTLPGPAIAYVLGESADETVLASLKMRAGVHGKRSIGSPARLTQAVTNPYPLAPAASQPFELTNRTFDRSHPKRSHTRS